MKKLFFPMYSMRSYQDGRYNITSCGHFAICLAQIVHEIKTKLHKTCDYTLIIPTNTLTKIEDLSLKSYGLTFEQRKRIHLYAIPYAYNAAANRLNFDYNLWRQLLIEGNFDSIYTFMPNLNVNLKNIIKTDSLKTQIVSFMDHTIVGGVRKELDIIGYSVADILVMLHYGCGEMMQAMVDRGYKVPPSTSDERTVSADELNFYKRPKDEKRFTVFYPSRLSDPERTKSDVVMKALEKFSYMHPLVEVYISDPSDTMAGTAPGNIILYYHDRDAYVKKMWKSHVTLCMTDLDKSFQNFVREAVYCNTAVIAPQSFYFTPDMPGFITQVTEEAIYNKLIAMFHVWQQQSNAFDALVRQHYYKLKRRWVYEGKANEGGSQSGCSH